MSCKSFRSLEYQALFKITVTLWSNSDVATLAKFHFLSSTCEERRREWKPIEDKVIEKISRLPLPKCMQNKVLPYVRPIGLEIYKWKEFQNSILKENEETFLNTSLRNFCWTPQGAVDHKKTAEKLVRNRNLEITRLYILACINCIEEEIIVLWEKIPLQKKSDFYLKTVIDKPNLIQFWTGVITKSLHKIPFNFLFLSDWSCGFLIAAENQMKSAVEFFWLKLTDNEKIKYWGDAVSKVREAIYSNSGIYSSETCYCFSNYNSADIICFLRSCGDGLHKFAKNYDGLHKFAKNDMDNLQQKGNLVQWPHHGCFLETKNTKKVIGRGYDQFFFNILHKVESGFHDYDYSKLYRDLWQVKPIFSENTLNILLPRLFKIGDRETISFILKDFQPEIMRKCSMNTCLLLAINGNWPLFEFFIAQNYPSEAQLIRFRDFISAQRSCTKVSEPKEDINSKIYLFINGLLLNYSKKRKCDIVNESHSKRGYKEDS